MTIISRFMMLVVSVALAVPLAADNDMDSLEARLHLQHIGELHQALTSEKVSAENLFSEQIETIHEALPRGHQFMSQFDEALDQAQPGFNLFNDPSYIQLLALRDVVEEVESDFVAGYLELWKVYVGNVPELKNKSTRARAENTISAVHQMILSADRQNQVALARLGHQLLDLHKSFQSQRAIRKTDPLLKQLGEAAAHISFASPEDMSAAYDEALPNIRRSAQMIARDSSLALRVDQDATQVRAAMGRSTFKNINGNGFPAKKWVLTFDDGPHRTHTDAVAKVLKDNQTKAVFFWLSKNVSSYKTIAKNIYDAGHAIASHSIDHANLPKLSAAKIKNQVAGSSSVIESVLSGQGASNFRVRYFRCPYGAGVISPKSQTVMNAIADAGLTHVAWNVDSLDWQDKNSASVRDRVIKQMKNQGKGVILFHDIQGPTPNTVQLLFQSSYIKDSGISFSGL